MAIRTIDYGNDLDCEDDLNPSMVLVTGTRALSQALRRRLETPRKGLYRHPDYGYDLRHRLSSEAAPEEIRRGVEEELLKDERVQNCTAAVTMVDTEELAAETGRPIDTMIVEITVQAAGGTFDLVLGVNDVTVELLQGT